jgi:hypothetical protein
MPVDLQYISRYDFVMRRCGVVGSTLAFGSTGRGFDHEHRYFLHHSASAFNKLRSLV